MVMAHKHYRSIERPSSYRRHEERHRDYSSHRKRRRYDERDREREDHYYRDRSYNDSYTHLSKNRYYNEKDDSYTHKRSRKRSHSSPEGSCIPSWDDEERHYKIHLGESLIPRYKILDEMGEGTFGRVVECWDRHLKKRVAVKIVRAIEKYRDAAKLEIEVLDTLQKHDPYYDQPLIQMTSWFDFRGHICMVFEKHGLSLYDFMERNTFRPFSVEQVREIGYQLLHSITFLHSLKLIHTDLKPENILFVDSSYDYINPPQKPGSDFSPAPLRVPRDTSIKLIDFGSATFNHRYHTTVVSTRHYRAPEVILGMGWTYPCDMWSVACILLQLYTGDAVFQTRENREHLAMMEKVLGKFPEHFIEKADRHSQKYFRNGQVVFPEDDVTESHEREKKMTYVKNMRKLEEYIAPEDEQFLDLLQQLFVYDPHKRPKARHALKHPFFDKVRDKFQYRPFSSYDDDH